MKTITLTYDDKNTIAKKSIDYILSLGVFKTDTKNAVQTSIEDLKKGRVTKYKNVNDLFEKVLK